MQASLLMMDRLVSLLPTRPRLREVSSVNKLGIGALVVCMAAFVAGCATPTTNQVVPLGEGPIPSPGKARVIVWRQLNSEVFTGTLAIHDNELHIGDIAPGGILVWDRAPGRMELSLGRPNWFLHAPIGTTVSSGKTYEHRLNWAGQISPSIRQTQLLARSAALGDNEASVPATETSDPDYAKSADLPNRTGAATEAAFVELHSDELSPAESGPLQNVLRSAIEKTGYFRLQPASAVTKALAEATGKHADAGPNSLTCLAAVGKSLGVTEVIGGQIVRDGNSHLCIVGLVDVKRGRDRFLVYRRVDNADELIPAMRSLGIEFVRRYARDLPE